MGLFGKNKNQNDSEMLDFSFLGEGSKNDIEKFWKSCNFGAMKPDNSWNALILSAQKNYLSNRKMTRKETLAMLVLIDMAGKSVIENPNAPAPLKIFHQSLRFTTQDICKELNVETFLVDGKNIAVRDKTTKKLIDLS